MERVSDYERVVGYTEVSRTAPLLPGCRSSDRNHLTLVENLTRGAGQTGKLTPCKTIFWSMRGSKRKRLTRRYSRPLSCASPVLKLTGTTRARGKRCSRALMVS